MEKYFTLTCYSNNDKCYCLAYKYQCHAERALNTWYERENNNKHFGQILSVEPDYEITEEYDENGNEIVKRGRKREPKMIGFECQCKGNIVLTYLLGEELGDIEELNARDRFSD